MNFHWRAGSINWHAGIKRIDTFKSVWKWYYCWPYGLLPRWLRTWLVNNDIYEWNPSDLKGVRFWCEARKH